MDKHNWTTRTFHRTLQQAFPDERACAVEHFKRSRNRIAKWNERVMIAGAIVFCGLLIVGAL